MPALTGPERLCGLNKMCSLFPYQCKRVCRRVNFERLRDSDWQFDRLDKSELEHLYGLIDEDLCNAVRLEYEVDTHSMRDYGLTESEWSADHRYVGQQVLRYGYNMKKQRSLVIRKDIAQIKRIEEDIG